MALSRYRARQSAPTNAARSLRIEAARAGLHVGGLLRPGACDAHLLGQVFKHAVLFVFD
jgi:hypothetical protein